MDRPVKLFSEDIFFKHLTCFYVQCQKYFQVLIQWSSIPLDVYDESDSRDAGLPSCTYDIHISFGPKASLFCIIQGGQLPSTVTAIAQFLH